MVAANAQVSKSVGKHQESEQPFRFFDLPPELWTRICHMAMNDHVADIERQMPMSFHLSHADLKSIVCQPAIMKVCKLIRLETLPMYWSMAYMYEDEGDTCDGVSLGQWTKKLIAGGVGNLPKVTLRSSHEDCEEHFEKVFGESLEKLQKLSEEGEQPDRVVTYEVVWKKT